VTRNRVVGIFIGAGLAVGLTASPAVADPPQGGCPPGNDWVLAPTFVFIDALDNGNIADQNGDGLACFRVNKGQSDKHGGASSFTWKDNTNPLK
jgi:hypothetical protein